MIWPTEGRTDRRTDPRTGGRADLGAEAGFTLLEMMIVLIVLGLAAGVLLTRGPPRSKALDMRATAGEVAQGLRLARSRAIVSNRRVVFTVDLVRHSFSIDGAPPRALPAAVALSMISAVGEAAGPGRAGISFAPDGSSSGGRIGLAEGERRVQIGIDWLTGRVVVANAD